MPYVNVKITDENVTLEHKKAIISGITELLYQVLDKPHNTTFVVIDEVNTDNWGVGGQTVTQLREHQK